MLECLTHPIQLGISTAFNLCVFPPQQLRVPVHEIETFVIDPRSKLWGDMWMLLHPLSRKL